MTEPCYNLATYKSVGIQTPTLFLDVASSLWEPADPRGEDNVAPGRPGRIRGNRVPDQRVIPLVGYTRGVGATVAERQASWAAAEAAIGALLDPDVPGDLILLDGYLGLTGTATITAYPLGWVPGLPEGTMTFRRWSVTLESIEDTPDWAFDESP